MEVKRRKAPEATGPRSSQMWKCTTIAPAKRRNRIFVRGLDSGGRVVFERSFGSKGWFEHLHPVVMENEFRRRRGIVRILMKRYDKYGELLHDIFHDYSPETGEYLYGECCHPNKAITKY